MQIVTYLPTLIQFSNSEIPVSFMLELTHARFVNVRLDIGCG